MVPLATIYTSDYRYLRNMSQRMLISTLLTL